MLIRTITLEKKYVIFDSSQIKGIDCSTYPEHAGNAIVSLGDKAYLLDLQYHEFVRCLTAFIESGVTNVIPTFDKHYLGGKNA